MTSLIWREGLFAIPTRIIVIVAPINVVLNYTLGDCTSLRLFVLFTFDTVWGPERIRLGFIGAPIATAISFNLISLMSIFYGVFYVPRTAWYPLSSRMFTSLGVLVQLGLAGVGM
jgi:MATE family multidrug resistance protein